MVRAMSLGSTLLVLTLALVALALTAAFLHLAAQPQQRQKTVLRIATTTSVDSTGLLDALKREFELLHPDVEVTWVAVGTGQALQMAMRGDADMVITHDRPSEEQFISQGYGVHAVTFACNDFVILGPPDDPAGVRDTESAAEAFRLIALAGEQGRAIFVSRGDKSGTHLRELMLWSQAGVNATGRPWYRETGQGMAQTLMVTDQLRNAYTLSDRSTYLVFRDKLSLTVLFQGDPQLVNTYRAILVNSTRFPWVHHDAAYKFVKFLVSQRGQALIGSYTKGGAKLFNPCFGNASRLGVADPYEEEQVAWWMEQLQRDP